MKKTVEDHLPPLAALYEALAKAQADFGEIKRTKEATFQTQKGDDVSYHYAELHDFIEAIRPALAKNGLGFFQRLCVVQDPISGENRHGVETVLFHKSGAAITAKHPIYIQENRLLTPMQRLGVAETFARRYSLSMITGVASEEDVDDNPNAAAERSSIDDSPEFNQDMKHIERAKPAAKLSKDKTARVLYKELLGDIDQFVAALDVEGCSQFAIDRGPDINSLPADWRTHVLAEYKDAQIKIRSAPPKDEEQTDYDGGELDLGDQ